MKISRYDVQTLDIVPRPGGDPSAFCIFEYVYFARPDSIFEGKLSDLFCQTFKVDRNYTDMFERRYL